MRVQAEVQDDERVVRRHVLVDQDVIFVAVVRRCAFATVQTANAHAIHAAVDIKLERLNLFRHADGTSLIHKEVRIRNDTQGPVHQLRLVANEVGHPVAVRCAHLNDGLLWPAPHATGHLFRDYSLRDLCVGLAAKVDACFIR